MAKNNFRLFEYVDWNVVSGGDLEKPKNSVANIKLKMSGKTEVVTAAEGVGPVDALYNGLVKAIEKSNPESSRIVLTDYNVRYMRNDSKGASGFVMVSVTMASNGRTVHIPVESENILEASFQCLVQGFNRLLMPGHKI